MLLFPLPMEAEQLEEAAPKADAKMLGLGAGARTDGDSPWPTHMANPKNKIRTARSKSEVNMEVSYYGGNPQFSSIYRLIDAIFRL